MRILTIAAVALLLSFGLFSCGTIMQTYSYKAKGVDLDSYKTYAWVNLDRLEEANKQGQKRYARYILDLANEELHKKGFKLDVENPDAVFQFDTQIENRVKYSQSPTVSVGVGFGGPGYYMGGSVPVSGGQVTQSSYEEGVLSIEMFEPKTGKLLWRGWAQEEISFETDLESDLRMAVRNIFMKLPVKHKEK
ncbi:DUF4136 domain-containing protein [Algoriphagus sp. H41]|uniref:DUF4136 domain-containing protein n=1 Tax=Algoriphagus oliviformis TaxID=2811231 RepID=A0ABS3CA76_9BACT|nr:DUF4136 domain-containing protein [Algoriphagus oliviformis]MBN7812514.1 DUF4136 domain-containing protein [Algoriphagus oliviformis]